MKREKSGYSIQIVEQALDLLEQFSESNNTLSASELGKRLQLTACKTFRIIATLESCRYLEKSNAGNHYSLGYKNLHLGQTFYKQSGLLQQARPVLESLLRRSKETTDIAVMKDFHTVYLDSAVTNLPVKVVTRLGTKYPLNCTAAGKVLAAEIDEDILRKHLLSSTLKKYTSNTISDPEELLGHLRSIATLGYAVANEEMDLGVTCVGAPIRDYSRRVVAAVSVTAPTMRMSPERLAQELIPLVMEAGQEISAGLGYFRNVSTGLYSELGAAGRYSRESYLSSFGAQL